ncbi:MAG: ABC transporter permease [Lentisphaeria bacterium]|jgi:peptide/nickel transport system permease protein
MLRYLLKRLLAAGPTLLGVLLVTFLLFHVARGDPAQIMLGKNAQPLELEALRHRLKLDRPLLWGHWRQTELYPGQEFTPPRTLAPGEEWELPRAFAPEPGRRLRVELRLRGSLQLLAAGGAAARAESATATATTGWRTRRLELPGPPPAALRFRAGPGGAELRLVRFAAWQANPCDSQLAATLREILDLRRDPASGRWRLSLCNFGNSLVTGEPITQILRDGIPPSLLLMGLVFLGETILAMILAMAAAWTRGRWPDRLIFAGSVASMSVSYLVYIIAGQYLLGYRLNLFPVWGWGGARYLALPVLVGVVNGLGGGIRYYRTAFLNELHRDHVRTALAKGCGTLRLLAVHVFPNALVPVITRISVTLPFLFTGSLLLESFFGIPGLGYAGVNALANADLPLLKALVLAGAALFIACDLLADLLCAAADPRIRLR